MNLMCAGWELGNLWCAQEGKTGNLAWIKKKWDKVFFVLSLPCWTSARITKQDCVDKNLSLTL